MIPVAILAGGLATRMLPVTEKIPKSMIEVAGRPFIAHQLDLLCKNGVTDVVICAGHLCEKIQDFVGDGSQFELNVSYSIDGKKLLGTAGAIRNALPLLGNEFFTLYGDSYLVCNYLEVQEAYEEQDKLALMTVYRNENKYGKSNVEMSEGDIVAYDKKSDSPRMRHIDYGLGIFNAVCFSYSQSADLSSVYQDMLRARQLTACEVPYRFYEIGSPDGLAETEKLLCATSGI